MTALSDAEREVLARQHLCCNLTDAERDALNECECGHFRNEHSSDGCLATEDEPDRALDGVCICSHSPGAVIHHAVQGIRDAAREQVLAQVEALAEEMQAVADGSASFAAAREGLSDATALADHSAAMARWAGRVRALVASVREGAER